MVEKELTFRRKLCKSEGIKAALISFPRPIARAWSEFTEIDLTYYGDYIIVKPVRGGF
jgi:hypothetical protein